MKRVRVILLFCTVIFFIGARDPALNADVSVVFINYTDYSVKASVKHTGKKVKTQPGHFYYWYINNDIKMTEGGYDGKLLHGLYTSFYRDMSLKERGNFCLGEKDGEWRSWYKNGVIAEIHHYHHGLECGIAQYFSVQGTLLRSVHFRNGKPDGKTVLHLSDGKDSVIYYNHGIIKPAKQKKEFFNRSKHGSDSLTPSAGKDSSTTGRIGLSWPKNLLKRDTAGKLMDRPAQKKQKDGN